MQGNAQIWISDLENKFLMNCRTRHNLKVIRYLSEVATCIWSGSPTYDTFKEGSKDGRDPPQLHPWALNSRKRWWSQAYSLFSPQETNSHLSDGSVHLDQ